MRHIKRHRNGKCEALKKYIASQFMTPKKGKSHEKSNRIKVLY